MKERTMFLALGAALVAALPLTLAAHAAIVDADPDITATFVAEPASTEPTYAAKPACVGHVVTVWRDDPTPCDVLPGQSLDVAGLAFGNDAPWLLCDDMGGEWIGDGVDLCKGRDF